MTDPKTLSTLLGELDARYQTMIGKRPQQIPLRLYDDGAIVDATDEEVTALCNRAGDSDCPQAVAELFVALVNAYPALKEGIERLEREKATDAWHTGWQQAVKERDEARRECDQWREKWNATLDREARRNAEILQLNAANNEMREVLLTLSTADPKLLAEQPEMTAGIARMALQLANHWAAKGFVDAP